MKSALLKHYGKILLTVLVLGLSAYFGVPVGKEEVSDFLNTAPGLTEGSAGAPAVVTGSAGAPASPDAGP